MGRSVVLVAFDAEPSEREAAAELSGLADVRYRSDLRDGELSQVLERAEVLIAGGWRGSITSDMVSAMPSLRLIQTLAAGVNHVPFASIPESVLVSTGSGANSREVAEHAFALILSGAKNVVRHTAAMREGTYPQGEESRGLEGRVLGILGMGSIGSHVARIARCFGMTVYAYDLKSPFKAVADELYHPGQLGVFLEKLDFLVVCVPLTRKTKGMIGRRELSVMKRDAVLVNVSRGAVICEEDVYRHLRDNPSFTACLDVWWKYTPDGTFKQNFPFKELKNIVMTPHNATNCPGQRRRMVEFAFGKVTKFLRGESIEGLADPADYV